jgi:hypothetical protein
MWGRVKAAGDFWMNDPRLARAGRNKAWFSAVLAAAGAVVCLIERAWGVFAVCAVGCVLCVLLAVAAGQDAREDA